VVQLVKDNTLEELKKDIGGVLDALKELTKEIAALKVEQEKLRKSGRF
jgi:regulator of replication initiation timing